MTEQVIFKEKHVSLVIGDKLMLLESMIDDNFYRSKLGKLFEDKKCNTAVLIVKQRPWLEIYFELTLFVDNTPVTHWDLQKKSPDELIDVMGYDIDKHDDKANIDYLTSIFTESADYRFLRSFINDGAIKLLP